MNFSLPTIYKFDKTTCLIQAKQIFDDKKIAFSVIKVFVLK